MFEIATRCSDMQFEYNGQFYELVKGTDGINDTVYLDEKLEDGQLRFLSLQHLGDPAVEPRLLPLGLVEEFIHRMKNYFNI